MKKLSVLLMLSGIFVLSCNNDNNEESTDSGDFVTPTTACECVERTNALIEANIAGEENASEQEKLHKACQELMDDIGEARYMEQINICNEEAAKASGISVDTIIAIDTALALSITTCECKTQITELMNRAAKGEDVGEAFEVIDRKCGELRKYMGELEYSNALNECN